MVEENLFDSESETFGLPTRGPSAQKRRPCRLETRVVDRFAQRTKYEAAPAGRPQIKIESFELDAIPGVDKLRVRLRSKVAAARKRTS